MNDLANQIRKDALTQIYYAGSGHPGGCLSCADILAVLFGEVLKKDDVFILSKGHAAPALYSALARTKRIDMDMASFRKIDSPLQGHPSVRDLPQVQASTGSLGQGLSQAVGVALAKKYLNNPGKVYVLIGDGEIQEGICWEAFMCAAHYKLDNLVCILDNNGLQSDNYTDAIMCFEPLEEKIITFGWDYLVLATENLYAKSFMTKGKSGFPRFIDILTTKGKGVSFMVNIPKWHGSRGLTTDEYIQAMRELGYENDISAGSIW